MAENRPESVARATGHAAASAQGAGRLGNDGKGAATRASIGGPSGALGDAADGSAGTEVRCSRDVTQ